MRAQKAGKEGEKKGEGVRIPSSWGG